MCDVNLPVPDYHAFYSMSTVLMVISDRSGTLIPGSGYIKHDIQSLHGGPMSFTVEFFSFQ
jgi:hypothetical protein